MGHFLPNHQNRVSIHRPLCVPLLALFHILRHPAGGNAVFRKLDFKIVDKKLLVFLGVANGAGYLLQYVGMNYTTAAKAALFINLSAMWVAVLSPKLLGERFSGKKVVGILFGLAGIVFVSTNLDFSALGEGQLIGDLILIMSGVVWALFMVYNKKLVMNSTTQPHSNQ